jgi:threonine dehydratase
MRASLGSASTPPAKEKPLVGIGAIRRAARILRGVALQTPLVPFDPRPLLPLGPFAAGGDPHAGSLRLLLKAESLQPIGAFKIRGAYVAIASLPAAVRARGVITYSSGNHAQGVARAARLLGVPAVVVMPADAPTIKVERVRADGAEIVVVGPASEERRRRAETLAAERGLALIPPYDDDRIIAGQGTVGLEIAAAVADLTAVLVPVGGGGLASGVAAALRALRPEVRIVGVEPTLAADARDSLAAGRIVSWPAEAVSRTMADGTRTQSLGERTFAHLRRLLDGIVTVDEGEIAAAVRLAAEGSRLVVEPSGALALAAALFRPAAAGLLGRSGTVVAIVSGGNVDPRRYRELLASPIPLPAAEVTPP